MAWWKSGKSVRRRRQEPIISGQPLFGLFNKLALTPRPAGRDPGEGFAVQILGARAEAGASSIARALAEFAALNVDGPVALVDADPFTLSQFRLSRVQLRHSLQDVQRGTARLEQAIHPTGVDNLALLALTGAASHEEGRAAWTLSISALGEIVALLRSRFRWIVVDSAPAHELAFAHVLSRFTDGVVIVAESEKTRVPVVQQLTHQIRVNGGVPLGLAINKRQMPISDFLYKFL